MQTTKITMLIDAKGAPAGHTVVNYTKDESYDVPRELADEFILAKMAKLADAKGKPEQGPKRSGARGDKDDKGAGGDAGGDGAGGAAGGNNSE